MSTIAAARPDKLATLTTWILGRLFNPDALAHVHVRLWDGSTWPDETPRPATLVLRHPGALRAMFLPGTEVGLGEAYLYDDVDIEGDIEQVFGIVPSLLAASSGLAAKLALGSALLQLPQGGPKERYSSHHGRARLMGRPHSVERDRAAVTYHYDVSNDFYALWLDRRMIYSCAYFRSPKDGLDTAQEQKLDYICRKLRLQPRQRLLDIGCGWGGLVIHAAERCGVDATGITLSKPQAELANARIRSAGLSDHCRVLLRDYREMDESKGFDALVSIGMFEHVGAGLLPTYFRLAERLLQPGGVFLNHGIAIGPVARPSSPESSFSQAYVFPDGELVPINHTLRAAENCGLEVRDVESLREHYTLTLRSWVRRLEANHAASLAIVDEPTYRTWRLFMSGSAYGFNTGQLSVYQALLAKPTDLGKSGMPLTREDWYGTASTAKRRTIVGPRGGSRTRKTTARAQRR